MKLIVIIGSIIFILIIVFACNRKKKYNEEGENTSLAEKRSTDKNVYPELREQALNITSEMLELDISSEKEIYGIIMDWNMGNVIVTVISFKTGDASIYLSTGQGYIGGIGHKTITNAAKNFIQSGERILPKANKTDNKDIIKKTGVGFYFLTKSGKYYIEDDFSSIENGKSDLLELFEAGNEVITEYRLISDKK